MIALGLESRSLVIEGQVIHLVAYFSQQITEKAIKAVLYKNNESPWGHSLVDFLKNGEFLEDIQNLPDKEKIPELDLHYITPRHPDAVPNGNPASAYNEELASRLLKLAEKVLQYVENLPKNNQTNETT